MGNKVIFILGMFTLAIVAAIVMMNSRAPERPVVAATTPAPDMGASPNPFASFQTPAPDDRLQALQNQLDRLSQRVDQLEKQVATVSAEAATDEETAMQAPLSDALQENTGVKRILTAENLIKAGIDAQRADTIMRRKNDIELKKLELRDRATREHYLGSSRYNRELSELSQNDVSLREELGDDAYDRYLYASGQSNRVLVASVMTGSQAELAGMQKGDIILNYDDQNLFDWSELQQATTQGERGEYVNVSLLRDGQLLNLWVPRGPLGVRLGAARLEP